MSKHPNNTPEQKAQWQLNKSLGSRFIRLILTYNYEAYRQNENSKPQYDTSGRRVK